MLPKHKSMDTGQMTADSAQWTRKDFLAELARKFREVEKRNRCCGNRGTIRDSGHEHCAACGSELE